MKRQITANREIGIRAPSAPKSQERELSKAVEFIMANIATRFENQVFGELHKSTIEKFADAQPGNYASVYLKLANKVRRKLVKQFDDDRIDNLVRNVLDKTNRHNRDTLYGLVEKRIGISTTELTATEGLTFQINALTLETSQWVKRLRDDTIEYYTANSLRAMTQGLSLEEIMGEFKDMVEKRKNHARFTARNQIGNFNSIATKIRAQNLGITQGRWITSRDERVRESHQDRNGKVFDLDKGLYSSIDQKYLLPGVDYQCRCDYELIIPAAG